MKHMKNKFTSHAKEILNKLIFTTVNVKMCIDLCVLMLHISFWVFQRAL